MLHGDISNKTAPMLYIDLDDLVSLKEIEPTDVWGKIKKTFKVNKEYRYDVTKLAFVLSVTQRTDLNVVFVSRFKEFADYMKNRHNFFKVFGSIKLGVSVIYMASDTLAQVLHTRCGYFVSDSYPNMIDTPYIYTYDDIRKIIFK